MAEECYFQLLVEGCLDVALATLLIDKCKQRLPKKIKYLVYPINKQAIISELSKIEKRRLFSVAFMDADDGVEDTVKRIEEGFEEARLEKLNCKVPSYVIYIDEKAIAGVIFWAEPPKYETGRIEDLLCYHAERFCEKVIELIQRGQYGCFRVGTDTKVLKRAIEVLLGISKGSSIVIEGAESISFVKRPRCGIDPRRALEGCINSLNEYLACTLEVLKLITKSCLQVNERSR